MSDFPELPEKFKGSPIEPEEEYLAKRGWPVRIIDAHVLACGIDGEPEVKLPVSFIHGGPDTSENVRVIDGKSVRDTTVRFVGGQYAIYPSDAFKFLAWRIRSNKEMESRERDVVGRLMWIARHAVQQEPEEKPLDPINRKRMEDARPVHEKIRRLSSEGLTRQQIADEVDRTESTVSRVLNKT